MRRRGGRGKCKTKFPGVTWGQVSHETGVEPDGVIGSVSIKSDID